MTPVHETDELSAPVALCGADGRLNPAAVGWSRRPLHRCNLSGSWGRKKRWEYWCVTCDTHLLSLTYADLDYLGLVTVMFVDLETGQTVEKGVILPFAPGFGLPETVGGGDLHFAFPGLRLAMVEEGGGTRLQARFRNVKGQRLDAEVFVARPKAHETLNVVIPWSEERFQFTSKQNTLPATGQVEVEGRRYEFGPHNQSFGCLDHGRGIWPRRTVWNWASASGVQQGRTVGLQFGGQWTDGTGQNENALCVDGRLTKLADVRFTNDSRDWMRPWRIDPAEAVPEAANGDLVGLRFVPQFEKPLKVNLLAAGAEVHVCFGHFNGQLSTAQGETIVVDKLFGWAEEMRASW